MNANRNILRRLTALISALALLCGVATPAILTAVVQAATQVTSRSIQIGNSTVGATTTYKVSFTPQSAGDLSLVIDFCQESPIIGGTCTITNGVTFVSSTLTASNLPTGWTTITTSGSTVKVAGSTTALTAGTAYTFTITGVVNPTGTIATVGATGSFYGRLYAYGNNTYGTYVSATSIGNDQEYGGIALSTVANVNITATVMETLTFCASAAAPGTGCSATTAPSLTLGHGSPKALDSTATDTATAYTQLSTNALSGAVVTLVTTSSSTCSGLSRNSGSTCDIVANSPAAAITAGTAKFGLLVANGSGGTGTVTANANYATNPYMSTTAYSTPDPIESSSAATANVNSLLTYSASAATTTPAGVYSTTEALIATGTF